MTPDEILANAARRFARTADAVERHPGSKTGPDFAALVAAWREAYAELRKIAGEHPEAEA